MIVKFELIVYNNTKEFCKCFNADFPRAILIEFVLILARWKIMKCDFDNILFETFLRSLKYNINKSGLSFGVLDM